MIHSAMEEFPTNLVNALAGTLSAIDPEVTVYQRPLSSMDNVQAIGVYPVRVEDITTSMEIGNHFGPTLERWIIGVQALVKDADQQQGSRDHSLLLSLIEDILYNNPSLDLLLTSITSLSISGVRRRTQRRGIRARNFLQGQLAGDWYYLGTLEYWMESEKDAPN